MEQSGINECQTCMGICRQCHKECVLRIYKGNLVEHYGGFPSRKTYEECISRILEKDKLFTLSEKEDVFTNENERNPEWAVLKIEDGEFLKMIEKRESDCIYLMEMRLVQWNK